MRSLFAVAALAAVTGSRVSGASAPCTACHTVCVDTQADSADLGSFADVRVR